MTRPPPMGCANTPKNTAEGSEHMDLTKLKESFYRANLALIEIKTPWMEIDDVFYEARGTAWALSALSSSWSSGTI